jgi:predicted TIM-barrel fold metal-dependent hydrolase
MTQPLPYRINDADNHFVEPTDMYERYIEPRWRDKVVRVVRDERGRHVQLYAGRPSKTRLSRDCAPQTEAELAELLRALDPERAADPSNPGDGRARTPGMLLNRLNPYRGDAAQRRALIENFMRQEPAWGSRDLRLALMDEQGIHAALMFPGVLLALEYEFQDDVDALNANAQAYNRWVHAEVGYAWQGRMFLPAYIPLADPDWAVHELERVIREGAPLVEIITGHAHGGRANPRGGRSVADPVFDPFWARIDEARVRVATHLGPTDYAKYGADWSEDPSAVLGDFDALQWVFYWGDRPAMETVAGMILHGLFSRFPHVRVCLSEQGTVWLPYLLRKLDHAFLLGHRTRWGRLDRRPSEIFREHFVVAPFPEENVRRVVAEVGIEPIVFGSDFPHGEGLPFPGEYVAAQLEDMPEAHVSAIMRDNLARFLDLPTQ